MKQFQIRVMCCIDPDRTSSELDQAVKMLRGYRDLCLEYPSWWDSWFVPEDKEYLLKLFLSRPQDIWTPHPIT